MTLEIVEKAKELNALEDKKKALTEELEETKSKCAICNKELVDMMTDAETPEFVTDGCKFSIKQEIYASPVAGKQLDMIKALKENGAGDIVKEEVNVKTLASWVKEYESQHMEDENEADRELPPYLQGIVSLYKPFKAKIGKIKKKL